MKPDNILFSSYYSFNIKRCIEKEVAVKVEDINYFQKRKFQICTSILSANDSLTET